MGQEFISGIVQYREDIQADIFKLYVRIANFDYLGIGMRGGGAERNRMLLALRAAGARIETRGPESCRGEGT